MENKFLVETSARHIHLTDEAVRVLYGEGATLTVKKMLSQPGQFASANEKIRLVGPKGEMAVSVLGPTRSKNQVELSFTPGLRLVGPAGELDIAEGVIIAKRHIHMTPADAEAFNVTNGQIVKVLIRSARTTIFDDVVVRVSPNYALAMHIDTDECNAAAAFGTVYGELVP